MVITETIPESVRSKIIRANDHFKSLNDESIQYLRSNPAKVIAQPKPVPLRISLIVGDALQNLRSSLDYLVWELVLAENKQPTWKNAFPIHRTPERFNQTCARGRLDGVSTEAIAEIEKVQPYHQGENVEKSLLYVLDHFCNINKHRRLLLTTLRVGRADNVIIDGQAYTRVPFGDSDYGTEIRIHDKENQMKTANQMVGFIAFNEEPAKGTEVGTVLVSMSRHLVNDVIPQFEKFFRTGP
jgi:hypothetical protein